MPELPEVETTRRLIEPLVLGRTIDEIIHHQPHRYRNTELAHNRAITSTDRKGKYLLLGLEDDLEAVVHLGMTGGFRWQPHNHTRLILQTDQTILYFTDPRRFGRWWVIPAGAYHQVGLLGRLGPEPLSPLFTEQGLASALQQTLRPIKEVLLAQEAVAGLGNIYADESLWQAQIHPQQPASALGRPQVRKLHAAIIDVLGRAVKAGGSTLSDQSYQQPSGQPGYFQLEHRAYARQGLPCQRCHTPLLKITVGGRGTHFCPVCQPAPSSLTPARLARP